MEPEISTTPFTTTYPKRKAAVARLAKYSNVRIYARRAPSYGAQSASFCMNHRKSSVGLCSAPILVPLDIDCQFLFNPLFSISFLQVRLKVASRTSSSFSWYINTYMSSFSSSIKLGIFLCILRFSLFGVVWRDFFFTRRWQNWIEGNSKVFP